MILLSASARAGPIIRKDCSMNEYTNTVESSQKKPVGRQTLLLLALFGLVGLALACMI